MSPYQNQYDKQIKFAVVMYGGGSLAIYINGVAQELLKLAQATADTGNANLIGTSQIYRKIALVLSGSLSGHEEFTKPPGEQDKAVIKELVKNLDTSKAPAVRFVIDVLTGSSAGGINAVFLSKALVNNLNIEDLKKLWLIQGDFAKLLNDKKSVSDNNLTAADKPASLLNSQRMYLELLKALDGMDEQQSNREAIVDELDLFVTFTDFVGVPLPIALSDKTVIERRHKQVFNFRYDGKGINDFEKKNNPFLAFAARSTSAFPVAFEAMKLTDIDDIIDDCLPAYQKGKSDNGEWRKFFREVKDENGKLIEWKNRPFVDGGALDNKPFGYAIDKLTQRQAVGIVERKLLYIDPSPEEFKPEKHNAGKPNALQNLLAQASGLPRYETIREDLQRILERNRLINRVNRLTAKAIEDFEIIGSKVKPPTNETGNWDDKCIDQLVELKGEGSILYYRLRVSALIDNVARLVTQYLKIEADSDYFTALRALVNVWREENFRDYSQSKDRSEKKPISNFLSNFDVEYRLRRLRFVMQKAEYLLRHKDSVTDILFSAPAKKTAATVQNSITGIASAAPADSAQEYKRGVVSETSALLFSKEKSAEANEKSAASANPIASKEDFIPVIKAFQTELNQIYQKLLGEYHLLQAVLAGEAEKFPSAQTAQAAPFCVALNKVIESIAATENPKAANDADVTQAAFKGLQQIIASAKDLAREENNINAADEAAKPFYHQQAIGNSLEKAAAELKKYLAENLFAPARSQANSLLGLPKAETIRTFGINLDLENIVRDYLRQFYEIFDSYDQISFPIFFETPVGEAVEIEVVRISSRDAHSLINEEDKNETRRKLAGNYLSAFGAFLDPRWRLNDIMWGRLDGAERLISALLPDNAHAVVRDQLIDEANKMILGEMLLAVNSTSFRGTIVNALTLASTEAISQNAVDKLVLGLTAKRIQDGLSQALTGCLEPEQICNDVKGNYEVNRLLEPKPTLDIISRTTQVGGKILESIAEQQAQAGDRLSWISRLGSIFWGLVTVAAPNSLLNLLFFHWLKILYLFEVVLIVGSTILPNPTVQQFGIIALITTIAVNLIVLTLQDSMRGSDFFRLFKTAFAVLLAVLALAGCFFFYILISGEDNLWKEINNFKANLNTYGLTVKLLPATFFGILLLSLLAWREVRNKNIKQFGWALLLLTASLFGTGLWMHLKVADLPQMPTPIMALEFVHSTTEFQNIVARTSAAVPEISARGKLKTALLIDTFLFVPLYLVSFLLLCQLLALRRQAWFNRKTFLFFLSQDSWLETIREKKTQGYGGMIPSLAKDARWFLKNSVWLAIIAAITIIGAGAADCFENFHSYQILNLSFDQLENHEYVSLFGWSLFNLVRGGAIIKFLLTFLSMVILSLIFLRSLLWSSDPENQNQISINWQNIGLSLVFGGLLALAIVGAISTIIPSLRFLLSAVLFIQILILFLISLILIRLDKKFLKDF
ncbi:MAG: patatin-like protein [Pyrinomonadaceae bacterium]